MTEEKRQRKLQAEAAGDPVPTPACTAPPRAGAHPSLVSHPSLPWVAWLGLQVCTPSTGDFGKPSVFALKYKATTRGPSPLLHLGPCFLGRDQIFCHMWESTPRWGNEPQHTGPGRSGTQIYTAVPQ